MRKLFLTVSCDIVSTVHAWSSNIKFRQNSLVTNSMEGDSQYSVGGFGANTNVVTAVGSYITRLGFTTYDGIFYSPTDTVMGGISSFSSKGPSRDGRVKFDENLTCWKLIDADGDGDCWKKLPASICSMAYDHTNLDNWIVSTAIEINASLMAKVSILPVLVVSSYGLNINIHNAEGRALQIYDITGRLVTSSSSANGTFQVPNSALYILRVEGFRPKKVMLVG